MDCRDCGAEIGFATLNNGKRCPVESEEPEEYQVWLNPPGARVPTVVPEGDETVSIEHRGLTLVVEGEVLRVWTAFLPGGLSPLGGPCRVIGVEVHDCRPGVRGR